MTGPRTGSGKKGKLRRQESLTGGKTPRTRMAEEEFGVDLFATDTPRCIARQVGRYGYVMESVVQVK